MAVGKLAFYQRPDRCLVVSRLSSSKLDRMGMVLCPIAITDRAGICGSMNSQLQPHLAASCVLTAVLD